jgi:hypothetical protein
VLTTPWQAPLAVFARSRGFARAVGLLAATALAASVTPVDPVDLRFRTATIGLGPVLAAVPGAWLPVLLAPPGPDLEPRRAARLRGARAGWLGLLLLAGWLCGVLALRGAPGVGLVSARNLALIGGLSLLAGQVLPPLAAWLPAFVALSVTVVYGTLSMSAWPRGWALLLSPADRPLGQWLAAAVFLPGAALYVLRDSVT